jgi:hypothetical protein
MNATPDVYGKKAYRAQRDAKMYFQLTEKKMTVNEIATRWCVDWLVVKNAIEREATRLGVTLNLQNVTVKRKRNCG